MKETNPFKVLQKMEEHYYELSQNYLGIESIQDFLSDDVKKKAILFDLFQIGEQMNRLPKSLIAQLNNKDIVGLISIRNHIVHGYDQLDYRIIKSTIEKEICPFIQSIKNMAVKDYYKKISLMIRKSVRVFIDRPKGTVHQGITYELNYGYTKDIIAPDYEYQDAYIIDINEPIYDSCEGVVIAVVHRKNDNEDKLVVSTKPQKYSIEEIAKRVDYQEKYFDYEIKM